MVLSPPNLTSPVILIFLVETNIEILEVGKDWFITKSPEGLDCKARILIAGISVGICITVFAGCSSINIGFFNHVQPVVGSTIRIFDDSG